MKRVLLAAVVALFAMTSCSTYNGMVSKEEAVNRAWSNVETQYQRRADLIPNLVATVKGYAAHESGTLSAVTQARAAVMSAKTPEDKMAASNVLSDTLKSLFAVSEAYPELKANANFQQLQSELSDTENKISYARMSFNDCVLEYNNAIETFPGNVVAGSKFKERQGFEVQSEAVRQAPQVKF